MTSICFSDERLQNYGSSLTNSSLKLILTDSVFTDLLALVFLVRSMGLWAWLCSHNMIQGGAADAAFALWVCNTAY
jgi:hypothetical protein